MKNGEYSLYSCDGIQITAIDMSDVGIKANAYGPKHVLEKHSKDFTLYWLEYVPYQGLIRIHSGDDNDGEEELVMRDYMGNSIFFDVIGDTVYNVIETNLSIIRFL